MVYSPDNQWTTYITYPKAELWRSRADGIDKQQLTWAPMKATKPSWSPDGKRIVFSAKTPGDAWSAYVVSAAGGATEQLAPGHKITDPNWSQETGSIAVTSRDGGRTSIAILNSRTRTLFPLPGSEKISDPVWSPDGRFMTGSRESDLACMLFDVKRQEWLEW